MACFSVKVPVLAISASGALLLCGNGALDAQTVAPPHPYPVEVISQAGMSGANNSQHSASIRQKLANTIIPALEFRATTLSDAVEYLRQESRRRDPDPNPNPDARGVNILLNLPPAGTIAPRPAAPAPDNSIHGLPPDNPPSAQATPPAQPLPTANTRITLNLTRIPLGEALKYVAAQAGLKVKVEPYAVSLVPLTEVTDKMVIAVFSVPPNMISNVTDGLSHKTLLDEPATAAH
jgi:hypothetical protein